VAHLDHPGGDCFLVGQPDEHRIQGAQQFVPDFGTGREIG
jgi:hypothetical protein